MIAKTRWHDRLVTGGRGQRLDLAAVLGQRRLLGEQRAGGKVQRGQHVRVAGCHRRAAPNARPTAETPATERRFALGPAPRPRRPPHGPGAGRAARARPARWIHPDRRPGQRSRRPVRRRTRSTGRPRGPVAQVPPQRKVGRRRPAPRPGGSRPAGTPWCCANPDATPHPRSPPARSPAPRARRPPRSTHRRRATRRPDGPRPRSAGAARPGQGPGADPAVRTSTHAASAVPGSR